jgi:DNA-binding NtrC family response regulator
MITSRLIFPTDFDEQGLISLPGIDQAFAEQLPDVGIVPMKMEGMGTLRKMGIDGTYVYSGTFTSAEWLRGQSSRQMPANNTEFTLQNGDLLLFGGTSAIQDYLYILDEASIPQLQQESATRMLNSLLAVLRDLTAHGPVEEETSGFHIFTAFAEYMRDALDADHYYVKYGNKKASSIAEGNLHGIDLAKNHLEFSGRPVLLNAAHELEGAYGRPLGYAKLLVAPLYLDHARHGMLMFTRTLFHDAVERETHVEGFGHEALVFLTVAVRLFEDLLDYRHVMSGLRAADNQRAGYVQRRGDFPIRTIPPGLRHFLHQRIDPLLHEKDFHIMLLGESGSGKGYTAEYFHHNSKDENAPFVRCNLASIAPGMRLAELTGWVAGAFTNAMHDRTGYFEMAEGGTLFIDEFADMGYDEQVALLSFLGDGKYRPLGSKEEKEIKCRVVVATNQDLAALVREERFRGDLLNRFIAVFLPPLNERREDTEYHIRDFLKKYDRSITENAMNFLLQADYFEGNMWLLMKILHHLRIFCNRTEWELKDATAAWKEVTRVYGGPAAAGEPFFSVNEVRSLDSIITDYVRAACRRMHRAGVVTRTEWAKELGISINTLNKKLGTGWRP